MKHLLIRGFVLALVVAYIKPCLAEGTRGGGNAIGGKLVESYMVDPTTLREYNSIVAPLMKVLRAKSSCLANGLEGVFQKSAWFFIPENLIPLANEITGIPMGSSQVASQDPNGKEVWVNSNKYAELSSDKERAKLLVHEAVLGTISYNGSKYSVDDRVHVLTRKIVSLIFSKTFYQMTPDEFAEKMYDWMPTYFGFTLQETKRTLTGKCAFVL